MFSANIFSTNSPKQPQAYFTDDKMTRNSGNPVDRLSMQVSLELKPWALWSALGHGVVFFLSERDTSDLFSEAQNPFFSICCWFVGSCDHLKPSVCKCFPCNLVGFTSLFY